MIVRFSPKPGPETSLLNSSACRFKRTLLMSTRLRKVERFNTDVVDNREILRILTSFRNGNFSVRMPVDATGIAGKIYDALNDAIGSNERLAKELERVSNLVGKEGKINHRAAMPGATGSWAACIDSVNTLATDLIQPI